MSLPVRIIAGIAGLVAVAVGLSSVRSGVAQMSDGGPAVTALLAEIEGAVNGANATSMKVAPMFQALLGKVDSVGVAVVHRDEQETSHMVAALFDSTIVRFEHAAAISDSASRLETRDVQKRYLQATVEAYRHFAEATGINREIVGLVMDESITSNDELVPKVIDAGRRRDEALANGNAAQARASEIAKELVN